MSMEAEQDGVDYCSFGYSSPNPLPGLFDRVNELIKEYLHKYESRDSKVLEFKTPTELKKLVDLSLPNEGVGEDEIIDLCKKTLDYSVHVCKLFFTFSHFICNANAEI